MPSTIRSLLLVLLASVIVVVFLVITSRLLEPSEPTQLGVTALRSAYTRFDNVLSPAATQLLRERRVILSCTTSPTRLAYLHNVFKAMDLTLVHRIIVALPQRYKNSPDDSEALYPEPLPLWMTSSKLVEVVRCEHDPGPVCKLQPALLRFPQDIVITVDDDTRYPSTLVADLVNHMASFEDTPVVGSYVQHISFWNIPAVLWPTPPASEGTHVAEGFGGVAYPAWRLDAQRLLQLSQISKATRMADDIVISFHAASRAVPITILPPTVAHPFYIIQYAYGFLEDALHRQDDMQARYQAAVGDLMTVHENEQFATGRLICTHAFQANADWRPYATVAHHAGHMPLRQVKPDPTSEDRIHYVVGEHLGQWIDQVLPTLAQPFVLVTGRSDLSCPLQAAGEERTNLLYNHPLLLRAFHQNLDFVHPKAAAIPVGLDMHTLLHTPAWGMQVATLAEQERAFTQAGEAARATPLTARSPKVVINFNTSHSIERQRARDAVPPHLRVEVGSMDRYTLMRDVYSQHAFVLSPPGMGWDCHRLWEALLAGSIPIVQHGVPVEAGLLQGFPCVVVRDWNEISEPQLLQWKQQWEPFQPELQRLQASFWVQRIREAAVLNQ